MINRDSERTRLTQAVEQSPELVIMRGRRRVGKSYLLTHALRDERLIYFQADEQNEASHLASIGREAGRLLGGGTLRFDSWDDAFEFFGDQATSGGKLVLVLDEFQWMLKSQPALASILQRHWDKWDRDRTPVTICLSGSALSLMESLLAKSNPLHGRATYRPLLLPLDFRHSAEFGSADLSAAEKLRRFAILGGTPQYQAWAGARPLRKILRERVLKKGEQLYEEPLHLLREEQGIRDPGSYFSILKAIAQGATQNVEIANKAGIDTPTLAKMLARLEELGYVTSRTSLSTGKVNTRPRYVLEDNYFRFWFRYVFPNRSRLEAELVEDVALEIETDLDNFMGPTFEECCRYWARHFGPATGFPNSHEVGTYWTRKHDLEIDVVGVSDRRFTALGSCKWSQRADTHVLDELVNAREALGQSAGNAALFIFARGFKKPLVERARAEGVRLVSADELFGI